MASVARWSHRSHPFASREAQALSETKGKDLWLQRGPSLRLSRSEGMTILKRLSLTGKTSSLKCIANKRSHYTHFVEGGRAHHSSIVGCDRQTGQNRPAHTYGDARLSHQRPGDAITGGV